MKFAKQALSIGIWSADYKKLAKWYEEVLGFTFTDSAELPDDSYVACKVGEGWFWIGKHDKVEGKNKDPYRIMPEFYVESVTETYNALQGKDVRFIAKPFKEPISDNWCMTIQDPEDNILQFYGQK